MPIQINVVSFRVHAAETTSAINVSDVVTSARTVFSKRNLGYGFNIGLGGAVPSAGYLIDNDWIDSPVFSPLSQPDFTVGS